MIIDRYFSEPNGNICFTREQGSNFAKQMADDFNPLHDIDAKRFCIPGDLLFSIILAKYGISQHMEFVFSGMVVAGVELLMPERAEEMSINDQEGEKRGKYISRRILASEFDTELRTIFWPNLPAYSGAASR